MPLYWPPASSCINVMGAPHGPASTFFAMRGRWPRGSFGAALGLATEINGHLSVFAEGRRLCLHIAPYGRTLEHQPLHQGPACCAVEAYVPRLITSPSS